MSVKKAGKRSQLSHEIIRGGSEAPPDTSTKYSKTVSREMKWCLHVGQQNKMSML